VTAAEQHIVVRLAQQEPGALLSLLAGVLAPVVVGAAAPVVAPAPEVERRPGEDPYLISEDEFSYRSRYMHREEEKILRCRVNAARAQKAGYPDDARRYRMEADRRERKLGTSF
jgi:hypothetical protein